MTRILPILLLAAIAANATIAGAAEPQLVFDLALAEGSGDKPMIVVWAEKADGTFIRTLHMFSKDKKYYKEMLVWSAARATATEDANALDAVIGATPSWTGHQVVKIAAGDLLDGNAVIRVEQRKDKGGHYKKRKVPITADWPGVTLEKEGYIATLVITVEK